MPVPGNRFLPNESGLFESCYFVRVPEAIKRARELTALEKLVWAQLAWHSWKHGRIFPPQKTLADELGTSKRSVIRALEGLRRKGYIEWVTPELTQKRHGVANEYFLIWQSSFDQQQDPARKSQSGDKTAPVTGDSLAPESGANLANQNEEEKTKKKNEHTPARSTRVCSSPSSSQKDEEPKNTEELTPEEIGEFIQLLAGKQADNPGAYRTVLERKLRKGELTYSRKQLEELRGQNQPEQPPVEHQAQESKEHKEQKRQVSETLDRERDQGANQRDVIQRVLSGELFQDSDLTGIAEQQLQKEDPDTYNAEKANYSLLNSARAAMRFPEFAEKRVPGIIERMAKRDPDLADQLQEEWEAKKPDLGLDQAAHLGLPSLTPATGA